MRLLYVASDQRVPGRTGGSVHVLEVARGLAARGHEVHAVVSRQAGRPDLEEEGGVTWHRIAWFPPHRLFRWRAAGGCVPRSSAAHARSNSASLAAARAAACS